MKKQLPLLIAIIIIVGGGAFYGGMAYGQGIRGNRAGANFANLTPEQRQARALQFGGAGAGRGAAAGGFSSGEILSKDDKSITIKLRDGGSKIVLLAGTTQIMKSTAGAVTDLTVGEQVTATGTANADGSISAQTVQIRPAMPAVPAPVTN